MQPSLSKNTVLVAAVPWLFVLLWSTGFVAAKYAVQYSPPFKLLFLRGLFSCLVFLGLSLAMRVKLPSFQGMWSQFIVGLLLQACFLGGCFFAISQGMPAGLVALLTGTQPLLTAIYASMFQGKNLSKLTWAGIALGFLGVFLVLSPANHELSFGMLALVGALIGLLGVTAGTIAQNRIVPDGHILASTLFQYVALTLAAGLVALGTESRPITWNMDFALGLLWLVVGVSTAAMLLLMFMLQRGEATTIATYFYLVPVATTLMASMLFGEPLTGAILLGMGITVSGMLLVLRGGRIKVGSIFNQTNIQIESE